MSNRRAAIRREKMEREKIAKHKSPQGAFEKVTNQGTLHGRVLAACIVSYILKEKYKFSKGKLERLLELTNREVLKYDQPATQFNLAFYQERMVNRLSDVNLKIEVYDVKEKIYATRRNAVFMTSCAFMFIVLNQAFNFSSNAKGTGRIDIVMEYTLNEFIKFQLDKENHNVDSYIKKMKEKTGIVFE